MANLPESQRLAINEALQRLASEYQWDLTDVDLDTWTTALANFSHGEIVGAISRHLMDTTQTSTGSIASTYRPKIGQIVNHALAIRKEVEQAEQIKLAKTRVYEPKESESVVKRRGDYYKKLIRRQEDIGIKCRKDIIKRYDLSGRVDGGQSFVNEVLRRAERPRVFPKSGQKWVDDESPKGIPHDQIGLDYDRVMAVAEVVANERGIR